MHTYEHKKAPPSFHWGLSFFKKMQNESIPQHFYLNTKAKLFYIFNKISYSPQFSSKVHKCLQLALPPLGRQILNTELGSTLSPSLFIHHLPKTENSSLESGTVNLGSVYPEVTS